VSVLNGALLGAAAGGAAGLISDPDKVNLGKPAWE
jgi:gas vesicle protein